LVICKSDHLATTKESSAAFYASIDWKGFEERDLVVAETVKSKADRLTKIAGCENKLEYVLIGKDQTQKRRWNLLPSNDELYSLIDAMPMRRFEMRQRRGKN